MSTIVIGVYAGYVVDDARRDKRRPFATGRGIFSSKRIAERHRAMLEAEHSNHVVFLALPYERAIARYDIHV